MQKCQNSRLSKFCLQSQMRLTYLYDLLQVATIGYSKVLTDSALQADFIIHLHFFIKNAKIKVLTRPKPSVNMQRIHFGNADAVNTSETMNSR